MARRLLISIGLVLMVGSMLVPLVAAAPSNSIYQSTEVYTTRTDGCSNTAALRNAADALDDAWETETDALSTPVGTINADVVVNPAPNPVGITWTGTTVTANVSKYDVTQAERDSLAASSWGTVDTSSPSDPLTARSATLQDCSPRPAELYSGTTSARPVLWNATAGDNSTTLDAVMFEFSQPVAGFGAWFGDIESRVDGEGQPALVKLFDSAGNVLSTSQIPYSRQAPLAGGPSGRTECGGIQSSDALACGNQATIFLGFSFDTAQVARMLVIVGEDDSCLEIPDFCDGMSEHLSFVGPQLAVYEEGAVAPTTTTTTTTTTSTTTTTTTTTTIAPTTSTTTTTTAPTTTSTTTAPTTTTTEAVGGVDGSSSTTSSTTTSTSTTSTSTPSTSTTSTTVAPTSTTVAPTTTTEAPAVAQAVDVPVLAFTGFRTTAALVGLVLIILGLTMQAGAATIDPRRKPHGS